VWFAMPLTSLLDGALGDQLLDRQRQVLLSCAEALLTAAVARGRVLFESAALGCTTCHDGPAYSDRDRHRFTGNLRASDTPSLIGVAASAPYFHDGSAATLAEVLRDRGGVHGMIDGAAALADPQVADLTAFLESL